MIELKYISKASSKLKLSGLPAIMSVSTTWNEENNISGVLFFDHGYFGQVLEGSSTDVENTWSRIQKDPRHYEIELIGIKPIQKRRFPNWSMKLFNSEEFKDTFPKFSELVAEMTNSTNENVRSLRKIWGTF